MKKILIISILLFCFFGLIFPLFANGGGLDLKTVPENAVCCKLETEPVPGMIIIVGQEQYKECYFGPPINKKYYIAFPKSEAAWKLDCQIDGDPEWGWGVRTTEVITGGCWLKRDIIVEGVPWAAGTWVSYEECPTCCLLNTIYNVTDIVFVVAMALAGVLIVLGGVMFLFSGGVAERTKLARNIILYTIIGIAVVLLTRALIAIVARIVVG